MKIALVNFAEFTLEGMIYSIAYFNLRKYVFYDSDVKPIDNPHSLIIFSFIKNSFAQIRNYAF